VDPPTPSRNSWLVKAKPLETLPLSVNARHCDRESGRTAFSDAIWHAIRELFQYTFFQNYGASHSQPATVHPNRSPTWHSSSLGPPTMPPIETAANTHAFLLIALTAAPILALAFMKRRMPNALQAATALCVGGMAMMATPRHACAEGQPLMQWLLPGLGMIAILLFARSAFWRRVFAVGIWAGFFSLSFQFDSMVHEPGWTGNPNLDFSAWALNRMRRDSITAARDSGVAEEAFPAGWVRDMNVPESVRKPFERVDQRRVIRRAWHTTLTGLYPYDDAAQDYWYPGGPLDPQLNRVELRDRAFGDDSNDDRRSESRP
jgi:hypothetical protein